MNERAARGLDVALALAGAAVIAWGVLALGWSPFFVMLLFWLGYYDVPRRGDVA